MAHATVLLDPRLDIAGEGESSIFKGPRTQQYQVYESVAPTSPNLAHTIMGALQPDTLLASRVRVKADLVFQPSYTTQNIGTAGGITAVTTCPSAYSGPNVPVTITLSFAADVTLAVSMNNGEFGPATFVFTAAGATSQTQAVSGGGNITNTRMVAYTSQSAGTPVLFSTKPACFYTYNATAPTGGTLLSITAPAANAIVKGANISVTVTSTLATWVGGGDLGIAVYDYNYNSLFSGLVTFAANSVVGTTQTVVAPINSTTPNLPVYIAIDSVPGTGATCTSTANSAVTVTWSPSASTSTTAGASAAATVQNVVSVFPRDAYVTQWPFHAQVSSMELTMGQVTSTYQADDFALYARLARAVERRSETCAALPGTSLINLNYGATASTPYQAGNMRGLQFGDPNSDAYFSGGLGDLVLPNSAVEPIYWCNITGDVVGTSAFNASYGAPDAFGTYTSSVLIGAVPYTVQLSKQTGSGFPVPGGMGQYHFALFATPGTPAVGSVIACPFYIGMRSTETLKMPPFCVEALAHSKLPALPHIATFTLKTQFFTDGRCNALLPTSGYASIEGGSAWRNLTFVSCPRLQVHTEFIGSATSVAIPSLSFAPWLDIVRFRSPGVGPSMTTNDTVTSLAALPGGTMMAEVLCPPLAYVPDYLFLRVVPSDATALALRVGNNPIQRNVASYPIYGLNVKLENAVWGTQVSQERLYEMTVKNGYDVPWSVFTGLAAGGGQVPVSPAAGVVAPAFIANPGPLAQFTTWPHSQIATLGSGVLLQFGKDIQLAPNSSPGVAKPLRISVIVSYYSTIPTTFIGIDPADNGTTANAAAVSIPTNVGYNGATALTTLGQAEVLAHFITRQQMISSPGTNRIHTSSVLPASVEVARPNFLNITANVPDECETLANPGAAFAAVQNDQYIGAASFGGILAAAKGPGVAAPAVWGPG